jgi:hypothetical protein
MEGKVDKTQARPEFPPLQLLTSHAQQTNISDSSAAKAAKLL